MTWHPLSPYPYALIYIIWWPSLIFFYRRRDDQVWFFPSLLFVWNSDFLENVFCLFLGSFFISTFQEMWHIAGTDDFWERRGFSFHFRLVKETWAVHLITSPWVTSCGDSGISCGSRAQVWMGYNSEDTRPKVLWVKAKDGGALLLTWWENGSRLILTWKSQMVNLFGCD